MRVEREFTVAAPLARAWEQLVDGDALAACVPGAQMPGTGDAPRDGRELLVALNGSGPRFRATLRAVDADEDERVTTLRLAGREIGGTGLARGTVRTRLASADGRTRVSLRADLELTGRVPGDDIVERAADTLLGEFAERLEQGMLDRARRPEPTPAPDGAPLRADETSARAPGSPEPDPASASALERALAAPAARAGAGAGLLVLVLALLRAVLGRRGNRISVSVRYRW